MIAMKKNCCDDPAARMAAWGLETELVQRLVGGAKRTAAYRRIRNQLLVRCPIDVWVEEGIGFVHFNLTPAQGSQLGWAIFAIDPQDGRIIGAKALIPDATGKHVAVNELFASEPQPLAA